MPSCPYLLLATEEVMLKFVKTRLYFAYLLALWMAGTRQRKRTSRTLKLDVGHCNVSCIGFGEMQSKITPLQK